MEGNTASDVKVEALLRGEGSTRISARETREIIGTRDALTLADELAKTQVIPDEAVVRELHRRVLWNQSPLLTPGEYRRGENRVVDADGNPIFGTPVPGDVPELMRDFAAWLSNAASRHSPPVVAALAHLELVAIHPFNDGNGCPNPETYQRP
ncbi:MAG: Fic family protein [Dermatophilaceae bacterium]